MKNNADTQSEKSIYRTIGLLVIIATIYAVLRYSGILEYEFANDNRGYGFPFTFGLIASLHCIAVCGWINLSQCRRRSKRNRATAGDTVGGALNDTLASAAGTPDQPRAENADKPKTNRFAAIRPSLLYSAGRLTTYTVAGVVFGALGSMFTLSGDGRGLLVLKLILGALMFAMGLKLLDLLPRISWFVPKSGTRFARKMNTSVRRGKMPYIVGMFNWLMPCGPLQIAHLYAFSTGSPIRGGLSMMMFVLGTIPLTLGLGIFGTVAPKNTTRIIVAVGGVMVAVLGLCIFTQGWDFFGRFRS